jgi:hypothetical protein
VIGAIELFARVPRPVDRALVRSLASQAIERARAEQALRDNIARKGAILDAALDCVITIDCRRKRRRGEPRHRADVRLPRRGDDRSRPRGP